MLHNVNFKETDVEKSDKLENSPKNLNFSIWFIDLSAAI